MLNKIAAEMDRIAARVVEIKLLEASLHAEQKRLTEQHAALKARYVVLLAAQQRNQTLPSSRKQS